MLPQNQSFKHTSRSVLRPRSHVMLAIVPTPRQRQRWNVKQYVHGKASTDTDNWVETFGIDFCVCIAVNRMLKFALALTQTRTLRMNEPSARYDALMSAQVVQRWCWINLVSSGSWGEAEGAMPPPGPVEISHKKDGCQRQPHRFHVSRPSPYPAAGSCPVSGRWIVCVRLSISKQYKKHSSRMSSARLPTVRYMSK